MLPTTDQLRVQLGLVVADKAEQGHATAGLAEQLAALPGSYDELVAFAERLSALPLREDWPWHEPDDLAGIRAASAGQPDPEVSLALDAATRVRTAFLASVCGCILGKPFEFDPDLTEVRAALEPSGEWPLRAYASEEVISRLRHRIPQWTETARERIRWVAPDDDINYSILGMLLLERHGIAFTRAQLRDLWMFQLPFAVTFGPERAMLVRAGVASLDGGDPGGLDMWSSFLNPRDEWCGALIRVDAYGYACPGRPQLASELAWRDAGWTHRRTGVYASMFLAAAMALAPVVDDPLAMFEGALAVVPARSRFAAAVTDALAEVAAAGDWLDGYDRIHRRWPEHTHCRIFQEVGTVVNTLRFAPDAGKGIGMQVSQGNDTDSYGATAGSLLGLFHGAGSLDERWVEPFQDDLRPALALFHERSLSAVADRMSRLPALVASGAAPPVPDLPY
jgi:hypothetical protein